MEERKTEQESTFTVKDRRFWAEGQTEAAPAPEPVAAGEGAAGDTTVVLPFQAETKQLLELMIHSLYSHKEIFLRELISNASDALDRLRFEAVSHPEWLGEETLALRIEADPEARTLTISDNGIGMSREELVANIGTIAKSGTRELIGRLQGSRSDEQALELIGQFGVGFYSSFMVADEISLITRRAGQSEATAWSSLGDGSYTIGPARRDRQGTSVTLKLKPVDAESGIEDYTDPWVIKRLVKTYSDFVRYPIQMKVSRTEPEKDADGKPMAEGKQVTVVEDQTLNSMKAIWKRRAAEVKAEEYEEFYRHISHQWDAPLKTITLSAEGRIEYQAVMFIPSHAPYDLFYHGVETGLQLYVRSVRIMEHCSELLPSYLRFVRGVVEASDLPLNVSRELLQQNRQLAHIRRGLVKKVLDTLNTLQSDEPETYRTFFDEFGRALKEGVGTDEEHRDRLVPLLLFQSSADAAALTTLKDYVARMPAEQTEIYYHTGESRERIEASPHLEAFVERKREVLYLVDPVDELMLQSLPEFEGKKLKSIAMGDVTLDSGTAQQEAEAERQEAQDEAKGLLELLQKALDAQVKEVRLSSRLTTSPVCLVSQDHDYSPHLQRLMKRGRIHTPKHRRIMELNAKHPLFARMKQRFAADEGDPVLHDYAQLLLGQALLAEGSELPDGAQFSRLVAELMVRAS